MSVSYSEPFLLSDKGSTRATAYVMASKSCTIEARTHVVWLDAVSEIMGRTYDHAAGRWGETVHIGQGADNHATPTLSVDREHCLRIVYGPHAINWNEGRFKYAVAEEPNTISTFKPPDNARFANFGCSGTYASVTHTPQDVDMIVYRGGDYPYSTVFQRERKKGGWTTVKAIFRQDITPQYTNYGSCIACDAEGTIYVGSHFYNVGGDFNGPPEKKRSPGAAVLKSRDLGENWADMHDAPVHVPTLYSEDIAVPPVGRDGDVRIAGLTVDSRGVPWVLTCSPVFSSACLLLSHWTGSNWKSQDLMGCFPDNRRPSEACLTIDTNDRIHIAAAAAIPDGSEASWGHGSNEILHLMVTPDSSEVLCNQLSDTSPEVPAWHPNISKPGPFSPVEDPVILFTHGVKGEGCSPPDETEVYCLFVEGDK